MVLRLKIIRPPRQQSTGWRGYVVGLVTVAAATGGAYLVHTYFAPANIIMIYPLGVTITAIIGGFGPSILASVLSVLAFDFFFVTPYYTFAVDDTQYVFTFIVLLLVGVTISYLTSRVRQQTELARQRERETATLYALGRDLAISGTLESYMQAITSRIQDALGSDVAVYLPGPKGKTTLRKYKGGSFFTGNDPGFERATRVFQVHERLRTPDNTRYLPLVTARGTIGVLELKSPTPDMKLTAEQESLLGAYTDLVAVALEGILLAEQVRDAEILKGTEKLQAALFNAISHDLRTPLVSIIGTLSSLEQEEIGLDDAAKKNLIQVASEEAERLNHVITNLLDESRLEAGTVRLSRQLSEVQDLVGAALEQLGSRISHRSILIDTPQDLPFVSVDFGLMVQALANILDNAVKYSQDQSLIEITASQSEREVTVEITDHGVGVPEEDLGSIFDKFYRISRPDNVAGSGLGLSIAKGIIEAHRGSIEACNTPGGGLTIRVKIPIGAPMEKAE